MEGETKSRMTIFNYIKEFFGHIREFGRALVGNDESLVNGVDEIPDLDEYRNINSSDESVQKDIDELVKIKKALDKKKESAKRAKTSITESEKTRTSRGTKRIEEIVRDKEKE